jgi:streptogramin lyase
MGGGRPTWAAVLCAAAFALVPAGAAAAPCGSDRCHAARVTSALGGAVAPGPGRSAWLAGRGFLLRAGPGGGGRRVRAPVGTGADLVPAGRGAVWFSASGGRIGLAGARGGLRLFAVGPGRVGGLAGAAGGGVWFTASGVVGMLRPDGSVTASSVPDVAVRRHAIAAGPDGTPWFLLARTAGIGHLDAAGHVDRHPLGGRFAAGPRALAAGPDGGLWFTSPGARAVGRIGDSGSVASFPLSQPPYDLVGGPGGSLWVTMSAGRHWSIVRLTPSGFATFFQVRRAVRGIGPGPGGTVAIAERGAVERLTPFVGVRLIRAPFVSRQGVVLLRFLCPQFDLIFCAGRMEIRSGGLVLGATGFAQRSNDAPVTRVELTPAGRALVRARRALRALAVIDEHDQGGAHRRAVLALALRWGG